MRVLFNTSESCAYIAEAACAGYSTQWRAFFIRLADNSQTELMNTYISEPQAADLCRSALITGTLDLTPYGRTYFEYEYTKDKKVISENAASLW